MYVCVGYLQLRLPSLAFSSLISRGRRAGRQAETQAGDMIIQGMYGTIHACDVMCASMVDSVVSE